MTNMGGRRVNRRPCTDAEEAANWSLIADVINQITTNNNIFPGGENQWPFVRFELNEAFGATLGSGLAGADVLDDTGMDTGDDIVVYDVESRYGTAVAGDKGYGNIFGDTPVYEALVIGGGGGTSIDPDDVFNAITIDGGTYDPDTDTLTITVTGADDYTVLCSGTDTTPQYLFDKIDATCQATRDTNADALVKFQLDSTAAVDQNLISFLDASVIMGYDSIPDGETWQLSLARAGSTYSVKWKPVYDGASGTFTAVLSGSISAGTASAMASSTATIRSISSSGALTSEGTRVIYNPFPYSLPATAGGISAIYTCAKTWDDPSDEADDEYTIIGIDVMQLLYSLTGAGEKKALAIPESGTDATDIQWLGEECEE